MLVPSRRYNFFDDPFFEREVKPRGMTTDIVEKDNGYEFAIELPGYKKEDIKITLENGELNIQAINKKNVEEKVEGNVIRQERFYGEMSRSFYVGDNLSEEDITAKFEDGILKLNVPKKEETKPEKKYIEIN